MRPVTPRGFRDVLFEEAEERAALAAALVDVFASWGYRAVETPVVEEAATLEAAMGDLDSTAFRLLDLDGRLLALRPEMTVPIARLVASRLHETPGPHRLSYVADVFREHASLRGQSREFTQAGVELVGASGPSADAEIVLLLAEALDAAGLSDFALGVGTVAVLRALLEASDAPDSWRAEIMRACHERNLVALDRLVAAAPIAAPIAAAIAGVPRVRGGREAIDRCRELAGACGCAEALDELEAAWSLVEASRLAPHVTLDFGILRDFDYYTGLIVEAYAPGLGLPLGGGGRYDGVLGVLDAPAPAAGFAVGIERLHIALADRGAAPAPRRLDAVLAGPAGAAFRAAESLRAAGWRVSLSGAVGGHGIVAEARRLDAEEALLARDDGTVVRLDRDGEPALPLAVPFPDPPTRSWAKGGER
jgi:ATP phosphoribosyltransferase regulatory subunit